MKKEQLSEISFRNFKVLFEEQKFFSTEVFQNNGIFAIMEAIRFILENLGYREKYLKNPNLHSQTLRVITLPVSEKFLCQYM